MQTIKKHQKRKWACKELRNVREKTYTLYMGESFQDYSWIQDFEADFP